MSLQRVNRIVLTVLLHVGLIASLQAFPYSSIRIRPDATKREQLAAHEIRRYVYLKTGSLLPIEVFDESQLSDAAVLICPFPQLPAFLRSGLEIPDLSTAGSFILKNTSDRENPSLLVCGADATATLYATYEFIEKLGVRFYLHGDVISDIPVDPVGLQGLDEHHNPLFKIRGILPYHDFPEGPDWWNLEEYQAILAQLPKMKMNFFGLHCYPEGEPNAEPTVWHGLEQDITAEGRFLFSYPASYSSTIRGNWGYDSLMTGDYHCGAAQLFDKDIHCAEVMEGNCPYPAGTAEANTVFQKSYRQLEQAFEFTQSLGIRTGVGTRTPLIVPEALGARLDSLGRDPQELQTRVDLYRGTFAAIQKNYPIDYYFLWTPEKWTWEGRRAERMPATLADLFAASLALENSSLDAELVTCGWVLGPQGQRALFDKILPDTMILSSINRIAGMYPLDPAFQQIENHRSWAIPWLEDDAAFVSPQLWVGRMRCDAADARRYGCQGLIGIHWRTRLIVPNATALAEAAWQQENWISDQLPGGAMNGVAIRSDQPIAGTEYDDLYQTQFTVIPEYRLALPNGEYRVVLHFCELEYDEMGKRVFDISLQGQSRHHTLDIFEEVGKFHAFSAIIDDVRVENQILQINFEQINGYPCLAALEVSGADTAVRINCAGDNYQNFHGDQDPRAGHRCVSDDFYRDWCRIQFGPEIAPKIWPIFSRIDSRLPRPSQWANGGPGGIAPDQRPWETVRQEYDFVGELENLQPDVSGIANRERFDYWLHYFRYMRTNARINCIWGTLQTALDSATGNKPADKERILSLYREMLEQVTCLYDNLLRIVSTTAELGTIMNWEQHIFPHLIAETAREIEESIGEPLPADLQLSDQYRGEPRIIVPTTPGCVPKGDDLQLRVLYLARTPPKTASLYWRPLGQGRYRKTKLQHLGRGVYRASLLKLEQDIEYYISFTSKSIGSQNFPADYTRHPQTVVVLP